MTVRTRLLDCATRTAAPTLTNLANLFASKFIARPDVKAIQHPHAWGVHTKNGKADGERIPWRRADLDAHLAGERTFGHYFLSKESECKLFAFDIDLAKAGSVPTVSLSTENVDWENSFKQVTDLRSAWLDRRFVGRDYMKLQFKELAHKLCSSIYKDLEIPCAVAYSGSKGIHVYAFTGLIPASEARDGAQIVLDMIGGFKPQRGDNFFKHEDYENLSVEVFPKQGSLDGKDLGNLMRLPLGKNLKTPQEPTFFIDMRAPLGSMVPRDPIESLTIESPWHDSAN